MIFSFKSSSRRLRRVASRTVTLLVFAFAVCATIFLLARPEVTFPDLPAGAYTGWISNIPGENERATVYAERIRSADALLFIVFRENNKPQVVPVKPKQRKKYLGLFGTQRALEPLTVRSGEHTLTLTGSSGAFGFSGKTQASSGSSGSWSLSPVAVNDLRRSSPVSAEDFDLREWLRLKARAHYLGREYESLERTCLEYTVQRDRLAKFLENQDQLRERARERREQVNQELQALSAQEQAKNDELKQLARELGQLARITRRGQAIELARRVAKREAKWYAVNWQQGADLSALEESLAQKMNVDLLKLQSNVKRAQEIEALENSIALERARVEKLQ
ncbi:MAG TPA: hypothetical protein PLP17_00425, partial [Oligoflexia bacterium]|nr:hypothetical protein [Oligoflexia bacterium]